MVECADYFHSAPSKLQFSKKIPGTPYCPHPCTEICQVQYNGLTFDQLVHARSRASGHAVLMNSQAYYTVELLEHSKEKLILQLNQGITEQ